MTSKLVIRIRRHHLRHIDEALDELRQYIGEAKMTLIERTDGFHVELSLSCDDDEAAIHVFGQALILRFRDEDRYSWRYYEDDNLRWKSN